MRCRFETLTSCRNFDADRDDSVVTAMRRAIPSHVAWAAILICLVMVTTLTTYGQVYPTAAVVPPASQVTPLLGGPVIGNPNTGQLIVNGPVVGGPAAALQGAVPPVSGTPIMVEAPMDGQVIGGQVIGGPVVDPLLAAPGLQIPAPQPLVSSEGVPWLPDWMDPAVWFSPVFWDGSFELGINGQQGNAETFNIQSGFEISRETQNTNWDIDFAYAKNDAAGVLTQHNALLWSNWDFRLANPRWSWFNKLQLEYDEFKDFDLRLALSTGLGYLFIDNDITQFRGRAGLGTSREFGGNDDDWKPELVLGFDYARQLTQRQKFTITMDYFPNLEDFSDFRVVTDAGWELVLDEASNLSLKLGIIDRYDSTPGNAEENDLNYTLLLIWTI